MSTAMPHSPVPGQEPILIAGPPRSGTTWEFNVLRQAAGVLNQYEPDNLKHNPLALYALAGLHRFPMAEQASQSAGWQQFWDQVFAGGWQSGLPLRALRRWYRWRNRSVELAIQQRSGAPIPANPYLTYTPSQGAVNPFSSSRLVNWTEVAIRRPAGDRRVLVKSVHCLRTMDLLRERYRPRIVLITRSLPNLVASYLRTRFPDGCRGIGPTAPYRLEADRQLQAAGGSDWELFQRIVIQACELTRILIDYAAAQPEAILVRHETACLDPEAHYRSLFGRLGLAWSPKVENYLRQVDKPRTGTRAVRVASQEQVRYTDQLDDAQLEIIQVYAGIYSLADYAS